MDIAGGGKRMGVEISVRVQPQHPQFLAGVAAMARHRADRADAQAVVAAQQDGQLALAQFGMHRVVHRAVPGGHFRQMAVAVDGRLPGIGRAIQIAAVLDLEALGLDDRTQAGDAQGFRSHGGAARAGADVGGRSDQRDAARQGRGGRLGGFLHGADSGKERQNQAADGAAAGPAPAWPAWWTHLSAVAPAPALPWRDRGHCHGAAGVWGTMDRKPAALASIFHIHAHDPLVPAPSFLPAARLAAALALAAMASRFLPLPSRSRCASAWFRPWPTRRPRKPSRWPPGRAGGQAGGVQ